MNIYAMKRPRRMNAVSAGLTILLLAAVYAGWALLPVLWPLWQISGMMRTACAQAYRTTDNGEVIAYLMKEVQRSPLAVNEDNFRLERKPYAEDELLNLAPDARRKRRAQGRTCVLRFRYVDRYRLPILGTMYRMPYEASVRLDLRPNEGRGRALNDLVYNSCTCTSVRRGD